MEPGRDAARAAVSKWGARFAVVEYEPGISIDDAARQRDVELRQIVKTMVVRLEDGSFVLVLVPGDRVIDWPRLRELLGARRLSLADEEEAYASTGYRPGAITPLGASGSLDVIADEHVAGLDVASIGGGAHGVAIHLSGADLVAGLGATTAAVARPR